MQIVLVLTDDQVEIDLFKQLLEMFDYHMQSVATVEQAVTAFSTAQYAALLVDMNLCGDDRECVKVIRQIKFDAAKKTPVIAIIDRATEGYRLADELIDDFLSRPFEPEELRKLLLRHVYDSKYPNMKVVRSVIAPTQNRDS